MPVQISRVLVQGITSPPGQAVTLTDQATATVLGTGTSDPTTGAFSIPVPFGLFLQAQAGGDAEAQGALGTGTPGAQAGAAGGHAGAGATLGMSLPISGAAGGQGGVGGGPSQPVAGGAGGQGGAGATPTILNPGAQAGSAGGQAGGAGTLSHNVPLGGAAGGAATAGPSTAAQDPGLAGAAGGHAGGAASFTQGKPLAGAAGGQAGGSGAVATGSAPLVVTDNFNRANGAIGAGWHGVSGVALPTVAANALHPTSTTGYCFAVRDEAHAANQYAQALVELPGQLGRAIGVVARQTGDARTGYLVEAIYDDYEFTTTIHFWRLGPSTDTEMSAPVTLPEGTLSLWLRVEAEGTTIRARTSSDGVTWTTRATVTDANHASGTPAVHSFNAGTASYWDNWTSGDLP